VRKAGEQAVEYCKIKLTEVIISSVSTGGAGSGDRLTEKVTLNFGTVNMDYVPQDDKGAPVPPSPWAGTSLRILRHKRSSISLPHYLV
jgi:type VI protein secretion system component Hcp